jgi:XapX domain-containing protein
MKLYLISIGAGVLVGVIYALLGVRSPAPPVIALAGLAGILVGEQAVPLAKELIAGKQPVSVGMVSAHLRSHSLALLPTQTPESGRGNVARNETGRAYGHGANRRHHRPQCKSPHLGQVQPSGAGIRRGRQQVHRRR